jgi:hypothetical protein
MAERKTGAGMHLSGVLERAPQPKPPVESEESEVATDLPKNRAGGPAPKVARTVAARAAKRVKGRTVYIPDDLFERIIVQAHRRDETISDYVTRLLDRHVPDHRVIRSGAAVVSNDQAETDAA